MSNHKSWLKIWTCWFQGENEPGIPYVSKVCINAWRKLNSSIEIVVIDDLNVDFYVPEYKKILSKTQYLRTNSARSDLLRLLLLQQYGGMWVDASLLPMVSAEFFLPYVLQDNEYFTYRFIPRICPIDRSGDRECVSWLQIVTRPNHYLLNQWLLEFCDLFIHADPYPFYGVHQSLARLYDKNLEIRCVINSMPQISQHIPHSLTENKAKKTICHKEYLLISDNSHRLLQEREQRFRYFYSFVYKRPRHVDVLLRIASSWHDDISAGRDLSTIEVENAGLFPVKNMTDPLIGHDYSALMSTLRDGICFYDTKNTEMKIQPSIA